MGISKIQLNSRSQICDRLFLHTADGALKNLFVKASTSIKIVTFRLAH